MRKRVGVTVSSALTEHPLQTRYLLKDLFSHSLLHTNAHNADNIAVGYNKGHDWFEATLNTPMVYTSGIYKTGTETLEEAQK